MERMNKDRSRCHTGEDGDRLGDVHRKGWAKAAVGSLVKQLLFHWHSVCPATSKAAYWTCAALTPRLFLHLLAFFAIFLFSSLEVMSPSFVVSYTTNLTDRLPDASCTSSSHPNLCVWWPKLTQQTHHWQSRAGSPHCTLLCCLLPHCACLKSCELDRDYFPHILYTAQT